MSAHLEAAEKAAINILNNLDTIYSKDNRPPEMTDDSANSARPELKAFAQKTLGYVALARKDYEKAQTELTKPSLSIPIRARFPSGWRTRFWPKQDQAGIAAGGALRFLPGSGVRRSRQLPPTTGNRCKII